MYLIYDTETTGLPRNDAAPLDDFDNWPRLVQLAWQLHDVKGRLIEAHDILICPDGFDIPFNSTRIHGISTQMARDNGVPIQEAFDTFLPSLKQATFLVGHNIDFDVNILGSEFLRYGVHSNLADKKVIDTKEAGTHFCKIPGGRGGAFKWPTLMELYYECFGSRFSSAHNAAADVQATARIFFELVLQGEISEQNYKIPGATLESLQLDPGAVLDVKTFSPDTQGGSNGKKSVGVTSQELPSESPKPTLKSGSDLDHPSETYLNQLNLFEPINKPINRT